MLAHAHSHPSFAGAIAVARRDITPPPGIHMRLWGAADHEVASGVHRPLTATALALRPADAEPLVLLTLDLAWWKRPEDESAVRGALVEELELAPSHVVVALSHTHAAPAPSYADTDKPGGHLIAPYLEHLRDAVVDAAREALAQTRPATLNWTAGTCGLARNRDLPHGDRFVCGFNPAAPADDTLLVGRITDGHGASIGTIVNYACHPTTLAWQNRLISPDFVGAMREVVETATGAPCLFLQGASGELAPAQQYIDDTAVADRHGRHLGHAVLAALAGMMPPGMHLRYDGVVESGAPLGVWRATANQPSRALAAVELYVEIELKQMRPLAELAETWKDAGDRAARERLQRQKLARAALGNTTIANYPFWLWRIGDAFLVATPGEPYSLLQTELRRRFADRAVVVANIANGFSSGYLPPSDLYGLNLYQVWQTPYAAGSLERLVDAVERDVRELIGGSSG